VAQGHEADGRHEALPFVRGGDAEAHFDGECDVREVCGHYAGYLPEQVGLPEESSSAAFADLGDEGAAEVEVQMAVAGAADG